MKCGRELRNWRLKVGSPAPPPARPTAKAVAPAKLCYFADFEDVQLHIFDLSSSNEPVLVPLLTAKGLPHALARARTLEPFAGASVPNADAAIHADSGSA